MAARLTALIVVAIVTITVIAGLIVGAQRDDGDGPVDLIVHNARVFAADGTAPFDGAVAVRGNEIVRVGESREIRRLRRQGTLEIDAKGGTVLPGFNDAHLHFLSGGLGLERANLLDAKTLAEIESIIRTFAEQHPDRPWVIGRGWFYDPFPGGLPTRQMLDALVPDRPAYMTAYDGHTAWVNSKALEIAGVTKKTKDPQNGAIVRDPKTGEPTGVLKESAKGLVSRFLPEPTREDKLRALRAAMAEAHRFGITSIQNAHGDAEEFAIYDELHKANALTVRTYSALSIDAPLSDADADTLDALWKKYPDTPLFKTGALKLMGDGVIESHTAAMLAPYANKPGSKGQPNATDEDMKATVAKMDARGWQVMTHAIGDAAVRQALDAYEHAAKVNAAPARGRRHRVEHIETVDAADIPRFGALGVIASLEPLHGNPSPNQLVVWAGNIGEERASRAWAYRSIRQAGGRLAFGSDWPVVTPDPRTGIFTAVNRTTPDGVPPGGWLPGERLTLADALEAYTSGAAYASFDEGRKGRLAKGQLADLVVLSSDLFAVPAAKLLDVQVTHTIFDGRVVYERAKAQKARAATN